VSRWLREPLLHFVLLGAALFALNELVAKDPVNAGNADEATIVVTPGRIENLAALFAKTRQRPPTPDELRGLVDDYVLEEALYREGVAIGVDTNDTVVRRRVRQKMELMVDDLLDLAEPTEDDLRTWLAEHPHDYGAPPLTSFRQVYLSPGRRGETIREDARRLLAELRSAAADVDPHELGDPSLLEAAFADADPRRIDQAFGPGFADQLDELPLGEWSGPLESAFGLHLVAVDRRTEPTAPALADVRAAVERDWSYARRAEATERFNEQVLERYRVSIEWPTGGEPGRD